MFITERSKFPPRGYLNSQHGIWALFALMLSSCVAKGPKALKEAFVPVAWNSGPVLIDDGDILSLKTSLQQSLEWAKKQSPTRMFTIAERQFSAAELLFSLNGFMQILESTSDPKQILGRLPEFFQLYESTGNEEGKILGTGYYVPLVDGSFTQSAEYPIPVYSVPQDLISVTLGDFNPDLKGKTIRGRVDGNKLVAYWDRKAIRENNVLENKSPIIAWVKDEYSLFNIEIQGSGLIRTSTGEEKIIGYAGENGQPYKAVGKLLIDENKISREKMSMHAIRDYVKQNPGELKHVLYYNPSFVFFKFTGTQVVGSLNVPLTPGRSVATDQKVFPRAVPMFITVNKPSQATDGTIVSSGKISRFVFNQDTGGAIRGPGRFDYFWGAGNQAEDMAGIMRHEGRVYVLIPKLTSIATK